MVDHHRQVAVSALVGDLVDPDPAQPGETVDGGVDVGLDPVMIEPTVRHAMRISSVTAVLEHCTASQATVSSKAQVWPAP